MSETVPANDTPVRPLTLFSVAVTWVFASACLGALTNAVNGWFSPQYFVTVLGWRGVEDVWRASIAQGIFEGLWLGALFSLVFTAAVGIITRASCSYWFAVRHLLGIVAGTFVCWLIGGVAAPNSWAARAAELASGSAPRYRETSRPAFRACVPRWCRCKATSFWPVTSRNQRKNGIFGLCK